MITTYQTKIIHQSDKAKIEWIEEGKIVRKTFTGFIIGEEMKAAFNAGLACLQKNKGRKWLSDNRYVKVYKQEDSDWINNVWFPQTKKAGWKYWAVLEPKDFYGQMSMNRFIKDFAQQGIILKIFHEMDQAVEWLQGVD
ncbi:hypothetical protein Q0590_09245 [Rhodocytophaga aerolata]|uniref:STAS/SEC14 domain-containing protein n=1 Tax=Rhodocytophaga aerolata TaxID=455078 RepID=A0ABT8R2V6_9BACT|nr:hypothetical protein [Rhodocytophaga aerolata]MDO1446432.1 hypothetical protein [Rhodocytophaga aerolata]